MDQLLRGGLVLASVMLFALTPPTAVDQDAEAKIRSELRTMLSVSEGEVLEVVRDYSESFPEAAFYRASRQLGTHAKREHGAFVLVDGKALAVTSALDLAPVWRALGLTTALPSDELARIWTELLYQTGFVSSCPEVISSADAISAEMRIFYTDPQSLNAIDEPRLVETQAGREFTFFVRSAYGISQFRAEISELGVLTTDFVLLAAPGAH